MRKFILVALTTLAVFGGAIAIIASPAKATSTPPGIIGGKVHIKGFRIGGGQCLGNSCRLIVQDSDDGTPRCNNAPYSGNDFQCLGAIATPYWSVWWLRYGPISPGCYYYSIPYQAQLPNWYVYQAPALTANNWACGGANATFNQQRAFGAVLLA